MGWPRPVTDAFQILYLVIGVSVLFCFDPPRLVQQPPAHDIVYHDRDEPEDPRDVTVHEDQPELDAVAESDSVLAPWMNGGVN